MLATSWFLPCICFPNAEHIIVLDGYTPHYGKTAVCVLLVLIGPSIITAVKAVFERWNQDTIPGPLKFALTPWTLAWEDWKGTRTRTIHRLHQEYGPVVRVGPNEVSFNSLTAMRQIYGAGSAFGRPGSFYGMFDVYGRPHMFTFYTSPEHSARKKILSQMYSKSMVMKNPVADSIQSKIRQFIELIETDPHTASHLDKSLHYYSLDNITWMVYRDHGGATDALGKGASDRQILNDIEQPTARRYSWFQIHLPLYTRLAMSCGSLLKSALDFLGLLPGKIPLAYSGLQDYALATFKAHRPDDNSRAPNNACGLMERLLNEQKVDGGEEPPIPDLDIAAESADHLDAGLKTTSDTLMFSLWALSLPGNQRFQQRLAAEAGSVKDQQQADKGSISPAETCDRLPFLDAVVKETLRLYAPIPASQPRTSSRDTTIDGYYIPAGTLVSCQAYSLHRNSEVFNDPYTFNPDRWLVDEVEELRRWWWPFSSGGRMCLGMQYVQFSPFPSAPVPGSQLSLVVLY